MTTVTTRHYGRPSLFTTFTCNPKWHEIKNELLNSQTAKDRHDIVARIFKLKVDIMVNLLTKHEFFEEFLAHLYSIEWQKRGLTHVHILLWLKETIRPEQIDEIISAEIPDLEPYAVITQNMIHRPCEVPGTNRLCLGNRGRCTKRYSRRFVQVTQSYIDGYPLYKRRRPRRLPGKPDYLPGDENLGDDHFGKEFVIRDGQLAEAIIDNRYVVPYNPYLSKTFKAHINVEFSHSVNSIILLPSISI